MLGGDDDTIAAISTASGTGGIAVIRLSGPRALEVAKGVFRPLPPNFESHRVYFGNIVDPAADSMVDEVLLSYFARGRSYTGDEVVEISCHGGAFLSGIILDLLLRQGARLARRGEFTYRSVMNGKMDLVQAEGVLELIESQSLQAQRRALRQLKGQLSEKFQTIKKLILNSAAHIEADLDFSEEDIEIGSRDWLKNQISEASGMVESLLATESLGRVVKAGFQVAIVGEPNAGKSSLLNFLLGEDRAIVTEVAGTTRDVVEGELRMDGHRVLLRDTAGLRETTDRVERIGIDRARETMRDADLIWFLCEADRLDEAVIHLGAWPPELRNRTWILGSKIDLFGTPDFFEPESSGVRPFFVSAVTGQGIGDLRGALGRELSRILSEDSEVVIGSRQAEELRAVESRLLEAHRLLGEGASSEFVAFELKEALIRTQNILGEQFDDQIMDQVFSAFCLGK